MKKEIKIKQYIFLITLLFTLSFVVIINNCYIPVESSGTFIALGCHDYPDEEYDRDTLTYDNFRKWMGDHYAKWDEQHHKSDNVNINDFLDFEADLLMFTGHGDKGQIWLDNDSTLSANPDFIDWSNISWAIFSTCSTVSDNNGWDNAFGNGLHGIYGYMDVSFRPSTTWAIKYFIKLAFDSNNDSGRVPILDAWETANEFHCSPWSAIIQSDCKDKFWDPIEPNPNDSIEYYETDSYYWPYNEDSNIIDIISKSNKKIIIKTEIPDYNHEKWGYYVSVTKEDILKDKFNILKHVKKVKKDKILKEPYLSESFIIEDKVNRKNKDKKEMIEIYKSGAINYFSDIKSNLAKEKIKFKIDKAKEISKNFVNLNGGMPSDYLLDDIRIINKKKYNEKDYEIISYILLYRHKYNGLKIAGNGGDAIKVKVNNEGIGAYFRLNRKILKKKRIENKKPLKFKKALEKAFDSIIKNIDFSGNELTITGIDICYYSKHFLSTNIEEIMFPVWELEINKALKIYINIYTGDLEY